MEFQSILVLYLTLSTFKCTWSHQQAFIVVTLICMDWAWLLLDDLCRAFLCCINAIAMSDHREEVFKFYIIKVNSSSILLRCGAVCYIKHQAIKIL